MLRVSDRVEPLSGSRCAPPNVLPSAQDNSVGRLNVLSASMSTFVSPGGVVVLMPQQLSDLRQGRTRSEKLGSETVSEDMGAAVGATFDSHAIESGLGNHGDCAFGSKADVWRECADEQPSVRRLWAAIAQICNDSRANVWRYHIRARCRFLARTSISLARQSMSSRVSVATSSARTPSLASNNRMA